MSKHSKKVGVIIRLDKGGRVNIFEIHRRTTSRIEPFHTAYLASCLTESQELLGKFWALATARKKKWPVPSTHVRVVDEDILDDGRRVDIVIRASSSNLLIAVEAKTSDSSVKQGQLDDYLKRLEARYPSHKIWMTYLTPFNTKNKPKGSRGQEAIKEFNRFNTGYERGSERGYALSSHLSWVEVAELVWQGNDDVWRQHVKYIKETICKQPPLVVGWGSLDEDLGWEIMRDFWHEIDKTGFHADKGVITLKQDNDPEALTGALKLLLSSEKVRSKTIGRRTVAEGVKSELVQSTYGQFHQQVFQLLDEYPFLGIRGKKGYGLTLPVQGVHRVVSICTSKLEYPERLTIGRKPS